MNDSDFEKLDHRMLQNSVHTKQMEIQIQQFATDTKASQIRVEKYLIEIRAIVAFLVSVIVIWLWRSQ